MNRGEFRLAHLKRLWQPGRLLFWQMLLFNVLSSACAWALRSLPLSGLGTVVVGLIGLMNVGFGLLAAWALLRETPPEQATGDRADEAERDRASGGT